MTLSYIQPDRSRLPTVALPGRCFLQSGDEQNQSLLLLGIYHISAPALAKIMTGFRKYITHCNATREKSHGHR